MRLRLYVAVAALNQTFEHPEVPAEASARLLRVHGDGEGEVVIELDRLGDRSVRMSVETRAEMSWTDADGERELEVTRKLRYESSQE